MTNKEIAKAFQMLGKVMELHGENKFKIRSYANAYITLRKLQEPLSSLQESEISAIKGVGKAISAKIIELLETGENIGQFIKIAYTVLFNPSINSLLRIFYIHFFLLYKTKLSKSKNMECLYTVIHLELL